MVYYFKANVDEIDYDMYRSASVKEFEIILEQCGKLLRKALKPYFHSSKSVDQLYYKDVFKTSSFEKYNFSRIMRTFF